MRAVGKQYFRTVCESPALCLRKALLSIRLYLIFFYAVCILQEDRFEEPSIDMSLPYDFWYVVPWPTLVVLFFAHTIIIF